MFSKSKYVKKPFSHALSKNKKRELDFSSSLATDIIPTTQIILGNNILFLKIISCSSPSLGTMILTVFEDLPFISEQ